MLPSLSSNRSTRARSQIARSGWFRRRSRGSSARRPRVHRTGPPVRNPSCRPTDIETLTIGVSYTSDTRSPCHVTYSAELAAWREIRLIGAGHWHQAVRLVVGAEPGDLRVFTGTAGAGLLPVAGAGDD